MSLLLSQTLTDIAYYGLISDDGAEGAVSGAAEETGVAAGAEPGKEPAFGAAPAGALATGVAPVATGAGFSSSTTWKKFLIDFSVPKATFLVLQMAHL